ncbi:MAG: redox-sensing transcriptional repressor Rex [bacterium]
MSETDQPANKERRLAPPTISRLSEYLIILEELGESGREVVSSRDLAALYGNNASQVRQDLCCLGHTGRVGHGYRVRELERMIRTTLGIDTIKKMVLVGCGRLGTTLAVHVPMAHYGMELVGAFDVSPQMIGTRLGPVRVQSARNIRDFCAKHGVALAVLTVPKTAAQDVSDALVAGGVRGILNYTRVRLRVPVGVAVKNRQIVCSFLQLFHATTAPPA